MYGRVFQEIPIRNVLEQIIRVASDVVSGVRYYYFDDLLDELRSGCSIELDQFQVTTDSLIRVRDRTSLIRQDSFECIEERCPILFILGASGTSQETHDFYCKTIYLNEDPCEQLRLPIPRAWVDIPLVIRSRIVGKLSVSLRPFTHSDHFSLDVDAIGRAIELITSEAGRWTSVLECTYSRQFFQPFLEAQLRIEKARTISELAQYCVDQLPFHFGSDYASVYLYERDSLGMHRVIKVASNDPHADEACVAQCQDLQTLSSEPDILFRACFRKVKCLYDLTSGSARATDLSQGFMFQHGGFGALLVIPIIDSAECRGVVVLRVVSSERSYISDRDLLLGDRLCSQIIGTRLEELVNSQCMMDLFSQYSSRSEKHIDHKNVPDVSATGQFSEFADELCCISEDLLGQAASQSIRCHFLLVTSGGGAFHAAVREAHRPLTERGEVFDICQTAIARLSNSECLFCCDVDRAIAQGHIPPVYAGARSLLGVRIGSDTRIYGYYVITSSGQNLSQWRHTQQLLCASRRAAASLANREILSCTLNGLLNDFQLFSRQLIRDTKNLTASTKSDIRGTLDAFKSILLSSCDLTEIEHTAINPKPISIFKLVDVATKVHAGRLAIVNSINPAVVFDSSAATVEGVLYKCLLSLYKDESPIRTVEIRGEEHDDAIGMLLILDECDSKLEQDLQRILSVDLLSELDGSRYFRSRWIASLRLAQRIANAYYYPSRDRRGEISLTRDRDRTAIRIWIPCVPSQPTIKQDSFTAISPPRITTEESPTAFMPT